MLEAKDTHKVVTVGDEYEVGFAEGKKAGMRKVVEWLDGRLGITKAGLLSTNIDYIEWQAFLKDLGIEQTKGERE